jgi:hypothetical protein
LASRNIFRRWIVESEAWLHLRSGIDNPDADLYRVRHFKVRPLPRDAEFISLVKCRGKTVRTELAAA